MAIGFGAISWEPNAQSNIWDQLRPAKRVKQAVTGYLGVSWIRLLGNLILCVDACIGLIDVLSYWSRFVIWDI